MSLDDKLDHITNVSKKVSTVAKCFANGEYNYRSDQRDGKQYCCLSDSSCMYFKNVAGKDLCVAYNTNARR